MQVISFRSSCISYLVFQEWGSGCTVPLHQISYDIHRELAEEFNLETYREIPTLSVTGSKENMSDIAWLDRKVSSCLMDNQTSQVTSLELTHKFMEHAQLAGAQLVYGTVDGIKIDNGIVRGVSIAGQGVLETDQVVLAMGPWTGALAEDWLGITLPIEGIKSTSMIFSGCTPIAEEPYACFCEEDENSCHLELYPRPNGELYVCGVGGSDHVRGDRLRPGGDCATSSLISGDKMRADTACSSLAAMTSVVAGKEPEIVQVIFFSWQYLLADDKL